MGTGGPAMTFSARASFFPLIPANAGIQGRNVIVSVSGFPLARE
jgi:hypothetical protein